MASASTNAEKKKSISFPQKSKRGQVKAQIFESLANTVASAASKIVKKIKGEGGSGGKSASSTPPPSVYNSDGN